MTLKENIQILSSELRKRVIRKFPRRSVYTNYVNEYWGADLVDMSNIKNKNQNITFLLNVVDLYSRFAWSIPLKSKSGKEVCDAFRSIGVWPKHLWVDEGKEFYNSFVKAWCAEHKIDMYSTHSGIKSAFAESFNKTMKEGFHRYFAEHLTTKFSNFLPVFMKNYNEVRIHSSTKETPYNIYHGIKPTQEVAKGDPVEKTKFKVGDYVRLSKIKRTFEPGYTNRWTYEVFKITFIDKRYKPVMYNLVDLHDEPIDGAFYEQELLITKIPQFKLIKSVVKRKKENRIDKVLVNYEGYDSSFDEWITKKEYDSFMKEKDALRKELADSINENE